jgi:hypothetical protein
LSGESGQAKMRRKIERVNEPPIESQSKNFDNEDMMRLQLSDGWKSWW